LNETAEYLQSIRVSIDEIETVAKIQMNSQGQTAGFLRFHAAYPSAEARLNLARLWVTMGLETDTEAIMAGLERWKGCERWRNRMILGMREWLENRMWEQEPPKGRVTKDDHRTAKAASEFPEPSLLSDLEAVSSRSYGQRSGMAEGQRSTTPTQQNDTRSEG